MNYTESDVRAFRRNDNSAARIERLKIIFQFAVTIVCSFIMGLLLIRMLPEQFYSNSVLRVSTHFETVFINCEGLYDYVLCILKYSLSDIICIVALFLVSFFTFNYVASDIVLIYNGIKIGSTLSFLWAFIANTALSYNLGVLRYVVVVVFKLALLILIFDYSCRSALYSHKLKVVSATGRPSVKMRALVPFVVNTIAYIGSLIIFNGIYCFLIYALK